MYLRQVRKAQFSWRGRHTCPVPPASHLQAPPPALRDWLALCKPHISFLVSRLPVRFCQEGEDLLSQSRSVFPAEAVSASSSQLPSAGSPSSAPKALQRHQSHQPRSLRKRGSLHKIFISWATHSRALEQLPAPLWVWTPLNSSVL